ncbi:DUF1090 family protein [Stutzerimonas urumqiensis]|uniref:DUF1090 family protein n=1 Tax=Stutzerimonas urumqiensis TaxID=638269 RepID=UPI003BAACA00
MRARLTLALTIATSLSLASLSGWCASTPQDCAGERQRLSEAMKEARLAGDNVRLTRLEGELTALNEACRGLVPVQQNHAAIEAATREVSRHEAALRQALGRNDTAGIELNQRRLDHARRQLDALRGR